MRELSKYLLLCVVGISATVLSAGCSTSKNQAKQTRPYIRLFNGSDIESWNHVLADSSISRDKVWKVEQGMIKCSGDPIGVLYAGPDATDFHLVVEYRWAPGAKPGNSGIFSRIEEPVTALPRAIELQLKHGDAGHVLGLKGKPVSAPGQPRYFEVKAHPVAGDISGTRRLGDAEKPPGEWNRVEILACGPKYTVWLNGQLINIAEGVHVSKGKVGIQSEGGEIHFRKMEFTPLD